VITAVGEFAQESGIYETNSWTEELLSSPKHSKADFLRVILRAIEDRKRYGPPERLLPVEFRLSDDALSTLINCTLDLAPEDLLSSENIKRSRQNIRERKLVG
jgi:MoxR-like ATPase